MNLMETDLTNFTYCLALFDGDDEEELIKSANKAVQYLDFKNCLTNYGTIISSDTVKEALDFIETKNNSELEKYLILRLALSDLSLPFVGRMYCKSENYELQSPYESLELYICSPNEVNEYIAIENKCCFDLLEKLKNISEHMNLEEASEEVIDAMMNVIKSCEDQQLDIKQQLHKNHHE